MRKLTFSDKHLLPWLTLFSGLAISAVAVWYSVAGLVAIFAASATAIIIMGVVLEVGKLVTAVYLHRYWNMTVRWLKTYLSIAVVFLMFITSMGIFGFLSKAHIEQTALSDESTAQITTINEKITRADAKIKRWQEEMDRLLQPATTNTVELVKGDTELLNNLRAQIDKEKTAIRQDYDPRIQALESRNNTSDADAVRKERDGKLAAVDKKHDRELKDIQYRINSARNAGKVKNADKRIKELEKFIDAEQKAIDSVREDKMVFEKEYRKLEAEVGPIKYIAAFIYGENPDKNVLEQAVTWVIIMIIFVFDPLAVGLLIASQYAFLLARGEGTQPLDTKEDEVSVLKKDGKTKVIERVIEVEADVDDTPPEDIQALEREVENKLEK